MSPEEAQDLIARDARNADVLFPYLNGEDLNQRPDQSPSRWAINFFDWPLDRVNAPEGYEGPVAADYPDCLRIVEEKVKPERSRNNEKRPREIWWQYTRPRTELYKTIKPLSRALVVAQTSKTLAFAFSGRELVFGHTLVVIALSDWSSFATLQSACHRAWTMTWASSLKGDARYIPSDCFATYPMPEDMIALHDYYGQESYEYRSTLLQQRQVGLTSFYNTFHDPSDRAADLRQLRTLQVNLDHSVAAAYGWADLALGHDFRETSQGLRFTISEEAQRERSSNVC